MAAVQISTNYGGYSGRYGPYQDGSGNLWVIAKDSTNNYLTAFKSSDAGASWGTSYSTSDTGGSISGYGLVDSVFDSANGVIYALWSASSTLKIWSFTISTTTWAEVYSSGTRPTSSADVNNFNPAFLTRRSTGEFVVFYQGPTHSLMGNPYRACYYARCSSAGVWQAGVEVSGAVKLHHYDAKSAVLGASDRSHFFFYDGAGSAGLTHRSVSSANALDTAANVWTSAGASANYMTATYNATLAKIVGAPTNQAVFRADSAAGPTWSQDTNNPFSSSLSDWANCPAVFIYEPTGAKVYTFFRDTTSNDVYYNSTDSTTWTTANAAVQDTATAVTGISVGLITNAIGVIFNDTNVYFDKFSLASGTTYTKAGYAVESVVA